MNAPVMEGGENCKVQQGAGMAVTKSDAEHEYAACVFLKWFTQKEQNLRFVCNSGYMPVKKDANSISALDELIAEQNLTINDKTYDCLKRYCRILRIPAIIQQRTLKTDLRQEKFWIIICPIKRQRTGRLLRRQWQQGLPEKRN